MEGEKNNYQLLGIGSKERKKNGFSSINFCSFVLNYEKICRIMNLTCVISGLFTVCIGFIAIVDVSLVCFIMFIIIYRCKE